MSVVRPGNAVEVKCIEPQLFCALSTLYGEDSDMNVQATEIAALDIYVRREFPTSLLQHRRGRTPAAGFPVETDVSEFLLR